MRFLFEIIMWAVVVFVFIKQSKKDEALAKEKAMKIYGDYYTKKRQEFTWLEKWIKDHIDPTEIRASVDAGGNIFLAGVVFIVLTFILGWVLKGVFFKLTYEKPEMVKVLIDAIRIAIAFVLASFVRKIIVKKQKTNDPSILEPTQGLTLECPSCHCPHSWVMVKEKNIVDGTSTMTTTKTTTIKGGGTDWGFGAGDRVVTSKKIKTLSHNGTAVRDFKCLNCGHTEHNEYNESWSEYPDEDAKTFNPPEAAWEVPIHSDMYKKYREQVKKELDKR